MSARGIGENSVEGGALRAFVERIEGLEGEKAELASEIGDVYREAKGDGYDVATLRRVVRLRRQDAERRRVDEEMLEAYLRSLGVV